MQSRIATLGRRRAPRLLIATVVLALGATLLWAPAQSSSDHRQGRYVIGAADDTTTPFNLVSLPALIRASYDGHGLRLVRRTDRNRVLDRWQIRYLGGGLTLTGTLALPRSPGPHPVVVTLHGYIPPPRYRVGAGLLREETRLAARGYAVLHPDYRNFGGVRTRVGRSPRAPLGYPADVLNAVAALRRARPAHVDTNRIGLLGRSMGGGVALQVAEARPSWFRALVLYSAVSADAADDYRQWVEPDQALARRVRAAYGTPRSRPTLWHDASAIHYVDRLTMPVQVHHGTADRICPVSWSIDTVKTMRAAGVDVVAAAYDGQPHRFTTSWPRFMGRVERFLGSALR